MIKGVHHFHDRPGDNNDLTLMITHRGFPGLFLDYNWIISYCDEWDSLFCFGFNFGEFCHHVSEFDSKTTISRNISEQGYIGTYRIPLRADSLLSTLTD